jgi:hypothetical protein
MKHLFLPLPIDTVRRAWDEWREANTGDADSVSLVEVQGGCYLVTASRPPRVFIDLLKSFMERRAGSLAGAR